MLANFLLRARFLYAVLAVAHILSGSSLCAETDEEAYGRVIAERAAKITDGMTFTDDQHKVRVQKLIADHYRNLRDIHAARDNQTTATQDPNTVVNFEHQAKLAMFETHNRFLAQLQAELSCDQVELVKDGLTYGVLNHTYTGYLVQLPELKEDQKGAIRAYLLEARELAMDEGSADEKHGVFRKYKGKINNYLSKAGYKM